MAISLAALIVQETKARIYQRALALAASLSVPVTSWRAGDPTRSSYHLVSELLEVLEAVVAPYIRAGFLDYATGDWLVLHADQAYGYTADEATYASTTVTLTNGGGGFYPDIAAGDLTFRSSVTEKTYRNTSGGTLASGPGTTLDVDVVADEAGEASSAGAGEIDEMVTTLLGVTCTNATAAVGTDAEEEESIRQGCRDKLGSLSPNGPRDAYAYVARASELTGTTGINRVRVLADADTGDVTVYLAGPSGPVSGADRTAAEEAIVEWALPWCVTPTVASATGVPVPITYAIDIYESVGVEEAAIKTAIEAALVTMIRTRPIGGDVKPPAVVGYLYLEMIRSTIRAVYPDKIFDVTVSTPGANTELDLNEVATFATPTGTVTLVEDP